MKVVTVRAGAREADDLQTFLSASGLDRVQAAAQKAVEFGKNEVDAEHLLLSKCCSLVTAREASVGQRRR